VRALAFSGQLGREAALNLVVNIRQDATDITLVNKSVPLSAVLFCSASKPSWSRCKRSINATPEEAKLLLPKIQLLGVPTVEPRLGQAAQVARSVCGDLTAEVGRSLEFYMSQVGMVRGRFRFSSRRTWYAVPEIDQFIATVSI